MSIAHWESSVARATRRLEAATRDEPALAEFWEACVDTIAEVVSFDACCLSAVDPVTLQFSAGTHVRNLPAEIVAPFMRNEFLVEGVNKYVDLHESGTTVSTLRDATAGDLEQSRLYREVYRPFGFGPELRALVNDGRTTWGYLTLLRELGAPDFTDEEALAVEVLSQPLALAMRESHRWSASGSTRLSTPGTIMVDLEGNLVSVSTQAKRALDGIGPAPVQAIAASAIARSQGDTGVSPKARLRTVGGDWLTMRGDTVTDADGRVTHASIVLEAAPVMHVASILARACGLSYREEVVLSRLARGLSTRQIAGQLFISEHTVRDHVKSIFVKTGCRSRGELVHRFFALDP